jgi:hypothetical protein
MKRFTAPPPPPPLDPQPPEPVAIDETSVVPDDGPRGAIAAGLRHKATLGAGTAGVGGAPVGAAGTLERGPFTVVGESVAWRCSQCGTSNPIDEAFCSACATPFAITMEEPEAIRSSDPRTAALLSLLFPGIGHAYIGDWGAALARAVLSFWVLGLTLLMSMGSDIPGSAGLAFILGSAAVGLWLIAVHDAYRSATGAEALVILRGKRYLYVTVGLLGILFLGLVLATFASRL